MAPRMMVPGAQRGGADLSWGEASVMPRSRVFDRDGVPIFAGSPCTAPFKGRRLVAVVRRLVSTSEVEVYRRGAALKIVPVGRIAVTGPFPGDRRKDWRTQ